MAGWGKGRTVGLAAPHLSPVGLGKAGDGPHLFVKPGPTSLGGLRSELEEPRKSLSPTMVAGEREGVEWGQRGCRRSPDAKFPAL